MTEALRERKNPCGNDREIDEYLNGTICEIIPDEEELSDIAAPGDVDFDVDAIAEPVEFIDEYLVRMN
jgi:hypothetical protein